MIVLAAIRPDSWSVPLVLHVLGAMILVGGVLTATLALALSWRGGTRADVTPYARLGFRALLFVALPAWFLMRIGGEWIYSKEGWGEGGAGEPDWLGIGYVIADAGGLLLLVSIVLAGMGARRLRRGDGERSKLSRVAAVIVPVLLLAYLIAVWAMTAKPG